MDTKIAIQLEIKKEKTMKLNLRIKSDKKKNMEYWDNMEDECRKLLDTILSDYASTNVSKIDEDTRIDISKSIKAKQSTTSIGITAPHGRG